MACRQCNGWQGRRRFAARVGRYTVHRIMLGTAILAGVAGGYCAETGSAAAQDATRGDADAVARSHAFHGFGNASRVRAGADPGRTSHQAAASAPRASPPAPRAFTAARTGPGAAGVRLSGRR